MNWFCIHTKPRKELQTAEHFQNALGLEPYFPKLRRQKTIRRVKRIVTGPLFPRYLFCRFDAATHFRAVRYAPEVINIVASGETPTVVDDVLIAELRSWAGESLDILTIQPGLKVGDTVEVSDGPMRGLRAVILHEMSDRERVAVLLSALGCGARMIINRSQLERVS